MNRLLRFDGRVAVVTGAGGGLGKAYALLLAERGAKVVVNDLGGTHHGEGSSHRAADQVVDEIKKRGGVAVPNYDSVTEGQNIIKTAVDSFGRIDILINNAGILRDKSFAKMSQDDWDLIYQVHLYGAFKTTKAAWEHFRNQSYGRVVMTSSSSGLFGNFGQANYAAAKLGLVGLSQTLRWEGAKFNIHSNAICPIAGSRMTEYILPPDLHNGLKPELIAPVVAWLCHEDCMENGSIIESSGGVASKYKLLRAAGATLRGKAGGDVTIESVQEKWGQVTDMDLDKADMPKNTDEAIVHIMKGMEEMASGGGISAEEVTKATFPDYKHPDTRFKYTIKDAILYALGVGVSTKDPLALNFLYENSEDFRVLPTFAVASAYQTMESILVIPGLNIDLAKVLHGEQYVELFRPLPPAAEIKLKTKVVDVMDKISGAAYIFTVEGSDKDGPLFTMEYSVFEVGAGKFGGNRDTTKPIKRIVLPPKRSADNVFEFKTGDDQAVLYRLSGDYNPIHVDPNFAALGGFSTPILHGLCSYGIAARLILQNYANSDPKNFKAIKVRFSKPVYPGQTIVVETWAEKNRVHFEAKAKETGETVLSGGYVDLNQPAVLTRSKL